MTAFFQMRVTVARPSWRSRIRRRWCCSTREARSSKATEWSMRWRGPWKERASSHSSSSTWRRDGASASSAAGYSDRPCACESNVMRHAGTAPISAAPPSLRPSDEFTLLLYYYIFNLLCYFVSSRKNMKKNYYYYYY